MARPGDWSPLGLHGDPTPGDADVLSSIHSQMEDLGSLAREVTSGLDRVLNQSTDSFVGKTAEAVRKKIDGHLKKFIDSVGNSFGVAAPATLDYLNAVQEAQAKADQALSAAQGLAKDDPQLDALKNQVHSAQDDYRSAVNTYVGKLSDASHMIQQPISGWQLFLQALGILAIILAVLGAIFGGWVGLIALAVNVALLIKTAVEFAEGKASVLDLVLAVIGVLFPSTKGLNLGSIGKGIFNALKNLPKTAVNGIGDVARGLTHIITNPSSLTGIFRSVTSLPGVVARGLISIGQITLNAGKVAVGALKSIGSAFRNDFALATIGVKGTLPKIGVYAMSFGSRFLVSATLPLDFFELGVGASAAVKMGLGTRLVTPWAHLAQPVVSGGTHVAALTAGHFGLGSTHTGGPGFGDFGHIGLGAPGAFRGIDTGMNTGLNLSGLHGLSTGIDTGGLHGLNTGLNVGGLHGLNTGVDVGGLHGLNTGVNVGGLHGLNTGVNVGGLHGLNTGLNAGGLHGLSTGASTGGLHGLGSTGAVHLSLGVTPDSIGHALGSVHPGASAVDHLTAFDHATGFDRTGAGLLSPSSAHFGGVNLGSMHVGGADIGGISAGVGGSHLGMSGLHTGRVDLTGSATGLHTAINDSMSGIRSAAGHVQDFHQLGISELKSIVDGDVSVVKVSPDGISLHIGAETAQPTALHMNFRSMSFTNDAGQHVVVAPEVHTAIGTGDAHAASGTGFTAPQVHTSVGTGDAHAASGTGFTAPQVHTSVGTGDAHAATNTGVTAPAPAGGTRAAAPTPTPTADRATVSAPTPARPLDELAGGGAASAGHGANGLTEHTGNLGQGPKSLTDRTGNPGGLAEGGGLHGVTAHDSTLGVSAQDRLDLAGRRTGTGDTSGAAQPLHGTPTPAEAAPVALAPTPLAVRPTSAPHPGASPAAGAGRAPRSRFEAITGGVGGRIGAERLTAWNKYEKATADAARAETALHDIGGALDKPSDNIDQAAAKLDAQQAAMGVDAARQDLAVLGMDTDAIHARLDLLTTSRPPAAAAHGATGAGRAVSADDTRLAALDKLSPPTHAPDRPGEFGAGSGAVHDGTGAGHPASADETSLAALDKLSVPSHAPDRPVGVGGEGPHGGDAAGHGFAEDARLAELEKLSPPTHMPEKSAIESAPSVPTEAPGEGLAKTTAWYADRLDGIAKDAGMSRADRAVHTDGIREAAAAGDLNEVARRYAVFRDHVELATFHTRFEAFETHVEGGFDRLGELGASRTEWQAKVDAVREARRTFDMDVTNAALRDFTAFVERHVPTEVLTGKDAARAFDAEMHRVLGDLSAARGPGEYVRAHGELTHLMETSALRDRLDALAGEVGDEERALRQRISNASGPDEAAAALQDLHDFQEQRALADRLDRLKSDDIAPPGPGLEERLDALRGDVTDPHEIELRRLVDEAPTADDAFRALGDLHEYQQERAFQERLDALRSDGPVGGGHGGAQDVPSEEDLVRRIDALRQGETDPRITELRQRIRDAATPEEAAGALDRLDQHMAEQETLRQQRVADFRARIDKLADERTEHLLNDRFDQAERVGGELDDLQRQLDGTLSHAEKQDALLTELHKAVDRPEAEGHLDRIVDKGLSVSHERAAAGDGMRSADETARLLDSLPNVGDHPLPHVPDDHAPGGDPHGGGTDTGAPHGTPGDSGFKGTGPAGDGLKGTHPTGDGLGSADPLRNDPLRDDPAGPGHVELPDPSRERPGAEPHTPGRDTGDTPPREPAPGTQELQLQAAREHLESPAATGGALDPAAHPIPTALTHEELRAAPDTAAQVKQAGHAEQEAVREIPREVLLHHEVNLQVQHAMPGAEHVGAEEVARIHADLAAHGSLAHMTVDRLAGDIVAVVLGHDLPRLRGGGKGDPKISVTPAAAEHVQQAFQNALNGEKRLVVGIDGPTIHVTDLMDKVITQIGASQHAGAITVNATDKNIYKAGSNAKLLLTHQADGAERPTTITFQLKLEGPHTADTTAGHETVAGPSTAAGTGQVTVPGDGISAERKFDIGAWFSDLMERRMEEPVMLAGGGQIVLKYGSPRPLADLDFRARKPYVASLADRLNDAVREEHPEVHLEPFGPDEKDKRALTGRIDGVEITIGPSNTVYHDVTTVSGIQVPSHLDALVDKALSFTRRTGEKKDKDLFDLLWALSTDPHGTVLLRENLDPLRNAGFQERGTDTLPLSAKLTQALTEVTKGKGLDRVRQTWQAFGAGPQDMDRLNATLDELKGAFRAGPGPHPAMIVTAGNFTGDMFGTAAALVLNPKLRVTVLTGPSHPDQVGGFLKETLTRRVIAERDTLLDKMRAKATSPEQFAETQAQILAEYDTRLQTELGRVHVLHSDTPHGVYSDVTRKEMPLDYGRVEPPVPENLRSTHFQKPVARGTEEVTERWDKQNIGRGRLRTAWGLNNSLQDERAQGFLRDVGVPENSKYVVLWSRFSGKKGGAHPQHDTSLTGMHQIIEALPHDVTVIIAGDKRPFGADRYGEWAASRDNVFDLTEFWKGDAWQRHFPDAGRADQFTVFDHLDQFARQQGGGLKHLGFRSGNLEPYALIGHDVRYLEEAGNPQAARMQQWHKDIGYERITVSKVPTLTGQVVVEDTRVAGREGAVPWRGGDAATVKDLKAQTLQGHNLDRGDRGFATDDLNAVTSYLHFPQHGSAAPAVAHGSGSAARTRVGAAPVKAGTKWKGKGRATPVTQAPVPSTETHLPSTAAPASASSHAATSTAPPPVRPAPATVRATRPPVTAAEQARWNGALAELSDALADLRTLESQGLGHWEGAGAEATYTAQHLLDSAQARVDRAQERVDELIGHDPHTVSPRAPQPSGRQVVSRQTVSAAPAVEPLKLRWTPAHKTAEGTQVDGSWGLHEGPAPEGTTPWQEWKDKEHRDRRALDVVVDAGELSQTDLHQFANLLIRADQHDLAGQVLAHAGALDAAARQAGSAGEHAERTIWTGEEIVAMAADLYDRLEGLSARAGEASFGPTASEVADLTALTTRLETALKGHIKGAAQFGGVYTLRGEYTLLTHTAHRYLDRLGPLSQWHGTHPGPAPRAATPISREVFALAQKMRRGRAYTDVPAGTQWSSVRSSLRELPLDQWPQEARTGFVRELSERNLQDLRAGRDRILAEDGRFQDLLTSLEKLPYRLKHATPAYHAIANSGVMSSQGDLARRGAKYLASGKSSAANTSSLGNDDFVFFRVEANDKPMQTRYGPTTLVFHPDVLGHYDGWVSLHDQLEPLDRPAMQRLEVDGTPVRTSAYAKNAQATGSHTTWTNTYPGVPGGSKTRTRKVSFEQEVFSGEHFVEGLALSVLREVRLIGGAFQEKALRLGEEITAALAKDGELTAAERAALDNARTELSDLVFSLYRPEAKFGAGLPVDLSHVRPSGLSKDVTTAPFRPLTVHNPYGDGRYLPDGTPDPHGFAAARLADRAGDSKREAEKALRGEVTGTRIDTAQWHIKRGLPDAEKAVERTKDFLAASGDDQAVRQLLADRQALVADLRKLETQARERLDALRLEREAAAAARPPQAAAPRPVSTAKADKKARRKALVEARGLDATPAPPTADGHVAPSAPPVAERSGSALSGLSLSSADHLPGTSAGEHAGDLSGTVRPAAGDSTGHLMGDSTGHLTGGGAGHLMGGGVEDHLVRTADPQWQAAREAAPAIPRSHTWVDPVSRPFGPGTGLESARYAVTSAFDARRFEYRGQPVTELTVKVHLVGRRGMAPQELDTLWDRARQGIDRLFNAPGHRLPNGDLLHVTVERAGSGDAHLSVAAAPPGTPSSQHVWAIDASDQELAHELGHQVGLRDEYRDDTAPQRPEVTGSLMGDYHRPAPFGLSQGGLRDRHLRLMHAVIGDLEDGAVVSHGVHDPVGTSPRAPQPATATRERPAAPRPPAEPELLRPRPAASTSRASVSFSAPTTSGAEHDVIEMTTFAPPAREGAAAHGLTETGTEAPVVPGPPAPPARMARHGQIGGSDRILPSATAERSLADGLFQGLEGAFGTHDLAALRAALEPELRSAVLPGLSAMTRGEVRKLTLDTGGWSGEVRVTARVEHAGTEDTLKSLEFEDGTESFHRGGFLRERQIAAGGGLLAKGKPAGLTDLTGQVALNWTRTTADRVAGGSRIFTRAKTPEPALKVGTVIRVDFDFSRVRGRFGGRLDLSGGGDAGPVSRIAVPVHLPVATSAAESGRTAALTGRSYLPPLRVEQTLALGGTDVVRDVFLVDAQGNRTGGTLSAALLGDREDPGSLAAFGQRTYGADWPRVRELVLARLGSLDVLQVRLKAMTGGDAFEIDLGERGTLLVTAEVSQMTHVRTTDKTEFNTGTDVTRVFGLTESRNRALRATFSAQSSDLKAGPVSLSGEANAQYEREGVNARQVSVRSGSAVKMKVPGTVFDGVATLTFAHRARPDGPLATGSGSARLGFQALTEAAEARPVAEARVFSAADRPAGPLRMQGPPVEAGDVAWRPAAEVWNGLPEHSVVLDVLLGEQPAAGRAADPSPAALVESLGSGYLGGHWDDLRSTAAEGVSREQLATSLPVMTRGTTVRGVPLTVPMRGDAHLWATATLESLEYLRPIDEAEINLLSEVTEDAADRLGSAVTQGESLQGGVQPSVSSAVAVGLHPFGAGRSDRWQKGSGVAAATNNINSAKYPEPMVAFLARARIDATLGRPGDTAARTGHTDVRFVVAVPQSHAQRYLVAEDTAGTQVFTRPAPPAPAATDAAAPAHAHGTVPEGGTVTAAEPLTTTEHATTEHVTAAPATADPATHDPATTVPATAERASAAENPPPLEFQPPDRVRQDGRIGAGDAVVRSGDGAAVVKALEKELGGTFKDKWSQVEADLNLFFDGAVLPPKLPGLTAGTSWGTKVSAGGVTADIRITSASATMTKYLRVEKKFEFEQGTETAAALSGTKSGTGRNTLWQRLVVRAPHTSVNLSRTRAFDTFTGRTLDRRFGAVAKGKTVEPAAMFEGDVVYTVRIKLSRAVPGFGGERTLTVRTNGEFAFPVRDLPVNPATRERPRPATQYRTPRRIEESRLLGATDIVLDARPDAVFDQLDAVGTRAFGSAKAWAAAKAKLRERMPADEFQRRLRSMTAGQPWIVRAGGRRVVLTASVRDMTHTGNTEATEFNSSALGSVTSGGPEAPLRGEHSTSTATAVGVVGTSNPVGVLPVEVFAGGTLTHTTVRDDVTESASAARAGAGTKTKAPGSVFDGTATLHVEFRQSWRPWGRAVDTRLRPGVRDEQRRVDSLRVQLDRLADRPEGDPEVRRLRQRFDAALTAQSDAVRERARATLAAAPATGASMTRTAFGVRRRFFGQADIGFQTLVESADAVRAERPAASVADTAAPADGTSRAGGSRTAETAPPARRVPVPPRTIWEHGLSGDHIVRDLPDVRSLRSLLDTEGRKEFGGAWDSVTRNGVPRSELVMGAFHKDRLLAELPRMTRGEELTSEPFHVGGRKAWVSATARVRRLAHDRPDPKAEVALLGESSAQVSHRALHARQGYLNAQLGALASDWKSKFGAAATFGGGMRLRRGGEQAAGGRTFANAKIPVPLEHYQGSVEITFTFHHGTSARPSGGVVPFAVSVPTAEITERIEATGDTYFTAPEKAPAATEEHPLPDRGTLLPGHGPDEPAAVEPERMAPAPAPAESAVVEHPLPDRGAVPAEHGRDEPAPAVVEHSLQDRGTVLAEHGQDQPARIAPAPTPAEPAAMAQPPLDQALSNPLNPRTPLHRTAPNRPLMDEATDRPGPLPRSGQPLDTITEEPEPVEEPVVVEQPPLNRPDPLTQVAANRPLTGEAPRHPASLPRSGEPLDTITEEPELIQGSVTDTLPLVMTDAATGHDVVSVLAGTPTGEPAVAAGTVEHPVRGPLPTIIEEPEPMEEPPAAPVAAPTAFDGVRRAHPEPIAGNTRWTMWGHNGATPQTSAYAVELGGLGLRGVYVPPAAGEGLGTWHWHTAADGEPVAVTPLTLLPPPVTDRTAAAAPQPPAVPALPPELVEQRLAGAPWAAGLRWREDREDLYVFGGAEGPEAVFAAGLLPTGDRLVHVAAHVRDGGDPGSLWVTASRDIGWLRDQARRAGGPDAAGDLLQRYGWRYDIAAPGGVDVNATLELAAPHPERREILFPGGVAGRHIRGAQRLHRGRPVGPYVTNPGFADGRGAGTGTEGTAR